jgi:ABC-type nitrate/sulfonate/bicarbonate transport system permease component
MIDLLATHGGTIIRGFFSTIAIVGGGFLIGAVAGIALAALAGQGRAASRKRRGSRSASPVDVPGKPDPASSRR